MNFYDVLGIYIMAMYSFSVICNPCTYYAPKDLNITAENITAENITAGNITDELQDDTMTTMEYVESVYNYLFNLMLMGCVCLMVATFALKWVVDSRSPEEIPKRRVARYPCKYCPVGHCNCAFFTEPRSDWAIKFY